MRFLWSCESLVPPERSTRWETIDWNRRARIVTQADPPPRTSGRRSYPHTREFVRAADDTPPRRVDRPRDVSLGPEPGGAVRNRRRAPERADGVSAVVGSARRHRSSGPSEVLHSVTHRWAPAATHLPSGP